MSLSRCPDCKRQVSERADSCPHCGCPFPHADFQVHVNSAFHRDVVHAASDLMIYVPLGFLTIFILLVCACC